MYDIIEHVLPFMEKHQLNFYFIKACGEGKLDKAQNLLAKYPNIDISHDDEFPFIASCQKGQLHMTKWLLKLVLLWIVMI